MIPRGRMLDPLENSPAPGQSSSSDDVGFQTEQKILVFVLKGKFLHIYKTNLPLGTSGARQAQNRPIHFVFER